MDEVQGNVCETGKGQTTREVGAVRTEEIIMFYGGRVLFFSTDYSHPS